jgi:hypothetical protein
VGDWIAPARQALLDVRGTQPGWGYRPGASPCVESTVLASFALMATQASQPATEAVEGSAAWLARLQQPSGALGVSAGASQPNWPTPWAVMLWSALAQYGEERGRALEWMLGVRGETFPPHPVFGHDTTILGWPWLAGTHAWVEPTSVAILALCGVGLGDHPRTADGLRLLRDRALESGGWNYGNTTVFDKELRPRPAPTGLALLALAAAHSEANSTVERALAYLESALPQIRSGQSCCWGLLALAAWGRRPAESDAWLSEAAERAAHRSGRAIELSYLLLASSDQSLHLLGAGEA